MVPHVLQIGSHVMLPKHPSTFKANCTLNLVKLSFIWRIVFWLDIYIDHNSHLQDGFNFIELFSASCVPYKFFRAIISNRFSKYLR